MPGTKYILWQKRVCPDWIVACLVHTLTRTQPVVSPSVQVNWCIPDPFCICRQGFFLHRGQGWVDVRSCGMGGRRRLLEASLLLTTHVRMYARQALVSLVAAVVACSTHQAMVCPPRKGVAAGVEPPFATIGLVSTVFCLVKETPSMSVYHHTAERVFVYNTPHRSCNPM